MTLTAGDIGDTLVASPSNLNVRKICAVAQLQSSQNQESENAAIVHRRLESMFGSEGVFGAFDPAGLVIEEPQVVVHKGD